MPASLVIAAALSVASVSSAAVAQSNPLDAFRGTARPVLIFTPDLRTAPGSDQLKRLRAKRAELSERDMPVFVVWRGYVATLSGARSTLDAAALRKAYGVDDTTFSVILVGKDGGEKFRSRAPVEADELLDLVDRMPMRRREAR